MITNADVWTITKLRLGLTNDTLKPLVDTYITEIERRIKHFCNIARVPDDLLHTWSSMVIDVVHVELPNIDEINDTNGAADGGTVKIGDTSISGGGSSGGAANNMTKSVIDSVVLNYKLDLYHYRRLSW